MPPLELPWCAYPRASDPDRHGLQPLPERLTACDFAAARPWRSEQHRAVPLTALKPAQILETARVVAHSFARREPMSRHIRPPAAPPPGLSEARHTDPFGTDPFGPWTTENIIHWFIRLFLLTDPASPAAAIAPNEDALGHSFAALSDAGRPIGGAFNETMAAPSAGHPLREGDVFLEAVLSFLHPIFTMLQAQDSAALAHLAGRYPDFAAAHAAGRVGHHFMVARGDDLPKADTFELVAATAEHFARAGYGYLCVEASNQWTGAACEALGGVRVHFSPFCAKADIHRSDVPLPGVVASRTGFLSDKDSGSMFYVIALADG